MLLWREPLRGQQLCQSGPLWPVETRPAPSKGFRYLLPCWVSSGCLYMSPGRIPCSFLAADADAAPAPDRRRVSGRNRLVYTECATFACCSLVLRLLLLCLSQQPQGSHWQSRYRPPRPLLGPPSLSLVWIEEQ